MANSNTGDEGCVWVEWSAQDYETAVNNDLFMLGLTFDDLEAQAAIDEFTSDAARRLWFAIKPLGANNSRPVVERS